MLRRKQELKKYSTKEGSKYEDLGLMAALHDLISQTYKSTFGEISQLIRVLYKFGKIETAKSLQVKLKDLELLIIVSIIQILLERLLSIQSSSSKLRLSRSSYLLLLYSGL